MTKMWHLYILSVFTASENDLNQSINSQSTTLIIAPVKYHSQNSNDAERSLSKLDQTLKVDGRTSTEKVRCDADVDPPASLVFRRFEASLAWVGGDLSKLLFIFVSFHWIKKLKFLEKKISAKNWKIEHEEIVDFLNLWVEGAPTESKTFYFTLQNDLTYFYILEVGGMNYFDRLFIGTQW